MEKVIVYIDGGNTYKSLFADCKRKDNAVISALISKGNIFDFKKFADFLASPNTLVDKKYYIGIVRNHDHTEKSEKMVKSQQKFLAALQNDGFNIKRGKIVYDHQIREKGVDVKIAIDVVIDCIEDKYDRAIIVSSDTDLIPALEYVQSKGKKVEYITFSNFVSVGMMKVADLQRVLSSADLAQFISLASTKI